MKFYLTGKQAQAIDKYTQETLGIPGLTLMESAAKKLAEAIDDAIINAEKYSAKNESYKKLVGFDKRSDKLLSVVESGNNGGDAVAAAWMLKEMGYDTYIYEIGGISRKTESYTAQIEKAKKAGVIFIDSFDIGQDSDEKCNSKEGLHNYKVIIDGIFGVGLTREVAGVQKTTVSWINQESINGAFVVGTDIPSGISADDGHILGTAVSCDMTVTFEYIKYGMLINEGRDYSGDIRCESIGLYVPESIAQMDEFFDNAKIRMLDDPSDLEKSRRDNESIFVYYEYDKEAAAGKMPERKPASNKGTYGKVLILAGSKQVYGAVYMAAEAAYRVGAGLVKVVTDVSNRDVLSDKLPEAMVLTYESDKLEASIRKNKRKNLFKRHNKLSSLYEDEFFTELRDAVKWADVILAGPGLGTGNVSRALLRFLAETVSEGQKLVLDADALNIISMGTPSKWFDRFSSRVGKGNIVITPHLMEMSRIVKANYNKAAYDFMMKGLGFDSDISFIKEYGKHQALSLSDSYGLITVLKDARTIVTNKEGLCLYVNTTGNSGMSKGGSGDVLAGMMAGLLAQNRASDISVMDTACLAVHLHGMAGDIARDKAGERSMLARDMIDSISETLIV